MRVPRRNRATSVGVNMTPMIDVVFQLIIFFLVSSHLAQQETQLELPLPVAESGRAPGGQEEEESIVVNVLRNGTILLAGRSLTIEGLEERLRTIHAERGTAEVRIRADRQVVYRHVEPIMLACYRSGMRQITYSVHRSRDAR